MQSRRWRHGATPGSNPHVCRSRRNQPACWCGDPVARQRPACCRRRRLMQRWTRTRRQRVGSLPRAPGPVAGRIAYVARSDSGADIFTILPDGSDRRRITFSGAGQPTWAPRGRRLAYSQGGDIWIAVKPDRRDRTKVTSGPRRWTPTPPGHPTATIWRSRAAAASSCST